MKTIFKKIATIAVATCVVAATMAGFVSAAEAPQEGRYALSFNEGIVEIESGQILGHMEDDVWYFLGVPYAQAERFQMPTKVEPWEGIRPCLTYGTIAPQNNPETVGGEKFYSVTPLGQEYQSENCQFLNIWTTDLNPETPKAVMVFLHGGGYSSGSSSDTNTQNLAEMAKFGDIVGVTINHRLNAFGFMDVSDFGEEYKYSANAGVGDMVAALEWIRDNIAQFGGDPGNVTIFGQSGGGGKVMTLMGCPAAKGLFHKAIVQSGGASSRTQEAAKADTAKFMEYLGISTIEEFLALSTTDILLAMKAVGGSFGPTVDGDYYPEPTFANGTFSTLPSDIPTMIGTTFGEFASNGVSIVSMGGIDSCIDGMTEEDVLAKLTETYTEDYAQPILDAFKKAYPNHAPQDSLHINFRSWDAEMNANYSGFALGKESCWSAIEKSKVSEAPVYSYVFAWTYPIFGGVTSTHGAELAFCFHMVKNYKAITLNSPVAWKLNDEVCRAWTNFAKTGDPSQEGLAWEPITEENGATMIFDEVSEVRYFHDRELMDLITQAPSSSGSSASEAAEAAEEAEPAEGESAEEEAPQD